MDRREFEISDEVILLRENLDHFMFRLSRILADRFQDSKIGGLPALERKL